MSAETHELASRRLLAHVLPHGTGIGHGWAEEAVDALTAHVLDEMRRSLDFQRLQQSSRPWSEG